MAACTKEGIQEQSNEIALTTPSLELSGVSEVVTRSTDDLLYDKAELGLYVYTEGKLIIDPGYREGTLTYDEPNWSVTKAVSVNDGPGSYNASILAKMDLKATDEVPAIHNAYYAYRGSINVHDNGYFAPYGKLINYSSAVQYVLKDHTGEVIEPEVGTYIITPIGLAQMTGFKTNFPKLDEEPIQKAVTYPTIDVLSVNGDYVPGKYPAVWTDGALTSLEESTEAWPLFTVKYCGEGFDTKNRPLGPFFVWNVSHTGEFELEIGKLHTFTINLSDPALAQSAVTTFSVR